MKNAVIVKSFQNGLILYLDKEIEFEELLEEVAAKFRNRSASSRMPPWRYPFVGRSLTLEEETRLVEAIMDNSSLNITRNCRRDEETERFYARPWSASEGRRRRRNLPGSSTEGTLREGTDSGNRIKHNSSGRCQSGIQRDFGRRHRCTGKPARQCLCGRQRRTEHYVAALEMAPQKLKVRGFQIYYQ